jgi:hypothetical protein
MMNRYVARTLFILAVAALPVVGLASPAAAKPINSVSELKSSCAKGTGTFVQSNDGTLGVCVLKDGSDVTCDDMKSGSKCTGTTARKQTKQVRLLLRILLDTIPSASGPGGGAGPGGGGSTNTPGTKPTGTTATTTKPTTTTTKPNVIQ